MKLLGGSKSKIIKDENGENMTYLENTEIVLIHCNVVNNSYQHNHHCAEISVIWLVERNAIKLLILIRY